jgi:hypothetical protein
VRAGLILFHYQQHKPPSYVLNERPVEGKGGKEGKGREGKEGEEERMKSPLPPTEDLFWCEEDTAHRSKQGGLALSISDHMCQRVWGGVSPISRRKGRGWGWFLFSDQ